MLNLLNHRIRCIYFYFVGGIVLGGVVVRRFNLKKSCRLSAKYCLIFQALSVWTAAAFIIPGCDEVNLAGVVKPYFKGYEEFQMLRRFPLNVRAVSAKIKLPKKYLQHCHILRTDKKNLSLLLLPS